MAGRSHLAAPATAAALAAVHLSLLLAPAAEAAGVLDAGEAALEGTATDLVERLVRLDLWDEGDAPEGRTYRLRLAPASASGPNPPGHVGDVEARWRDAQGAWGAWTPLEAAAVTAHGTAKQRHHGWDGVVEVALRARLPNVAEAQLTVLLVEERPGHAAYSFTTRLLADTLTFEAQVTGGGETDGSDASVIVARLLGGKAPEAVEAVHGPQRWSLAWEQGAWRRAVPEGVPEVRLLARFADGGLLDGPVLRLGGDGAAASDPPAERQETTGPAPHAPADPDGPGQPVEPEDPVEPRPGLPGAGEEGGGAGWSWELPPAAAPPSPGGADAHAPAGGTEVGGVLPTSGPPAVAVALVLGAAAGLARRSGRRSGCTRARPPIL